MTTEIHTTEPTDDAVEALTRAIYCLSPADEMPVGLIKEMAAKACLVRLSTQGYTLRRETTAPDGVAKQPEAQSAPAMTEVELEREAMSICNDRQYRDLPYLEMLRRIEELAKKYRG